MTNMKHGACTLKVADFQKWGLRLEFFAMQKKQKPWRRIGVCASGDRCEHGPVGFSSNIGDTGSFHGKELSTGKEAERLEYVLSFDIN